MSVTTPLLETEQERALPSSAVFELPQPSITRAALQ